MRLVDPNVSTEDSRSTTALRRVMRQSPRARAAVATIGSPSGIAATARATAVCTVSRVSRPVRKPIAATSASTLATASGTCVYREDNLRIGDS